MDLKQTYEWTNRNFKNTLAIHIARPLSASIDSAKKIAASISENILAYDSKSICVGLGLIVAQAGKAIEEQLSFKEVCDRVEWSCDHIQQLFTVEDFKYLIRGGRLKASKVKCYFAQSKTLNAYRPTGALKLFPKLLEAMASEKKCFTRSQSEYMAKISTFLQ
jgi:fatty acid-binding protein DegV